MGFMDKAKQLADQAQSKLDEAQKQFNASQSGSNPAAPAEGGIEYDQHGRPIAQPADAPHTAATPQQGDPALGAPVPPPAETTPQPSREERPQGDPLTDSAPKPPQPPAGGGGMQSGDPLAG